MSFNKKSEQAFTLIEVLFALTILAIALLALTEAGLTAIRMQGRMQNRLQASYVANNTITSLNTGLLALPKDQARVSGNTRMGMVSWVWQVDAGAAAGQEARPLVVIVTAPSHQGQWRFHGWMQGSI